MPTWAIHPISAFFDFIGWSFSVVIDRIFNYHSERVRAFMRRTIVKKALLLFLGLLLFSCVSFIIYIKSDPPLQLRGVAGHSNHTPPVTLDVQNHGMATIRVTEVLIDGRKAPKALLGIGHKGAIVQLPGTPSNETFTSNYQHHLIYPNCQVLSSLSFQKKITSTFVDHYGIVVYYTKPFQTVTVKYQYLGIPFSQRFNLNYIFNNSSF